MIRDSKEQSLKDRKCTHGICSLLRFYVQNDERCNEFLKAAFIHIYGEYKPFPIEGDASGFHKNRDKFSPNTNHGKARMELLDKLIAFARASDEAMLIELNSVGI